MMMKRKREPNVTLGIFPSVLRRDEDIVSDWGVIYRSGIELFAFYKTDL